MVDQSIFSELTQALKTQHFDRCPIDIELTESCLIDNAEQALEVIQQFRSLGAQIHLDDFGTGYSSLSQLARFPIDTLKLDHTFVQRVHDRSVSQSLVLAIIAVARALNLRIIAEGVEDTADDAFLTQNGVDERQGYLFARPMPAAELERWLKARSRVIS